MVMFTDLLPRLTLIPRLEFADGVSRVSELLSIYPKDQTTKDCGLEGEASIARNIRGYRTECEFFLD